MIVTIPFRVLAQEPDRKSAALAARKFAFTLAAIPFHVCAPASKQALAFLLFIAAMRL
jgi:hypothetical protein